MWPAAREPVSEEQRPLINIASEAMADESQKIGVTLAGFAALSENHAAFTWYLRPVLVLLPSRVAAFQAALPLPRAPFPPRAAHGVQGHLAVSCLGAGDLLPSLLGIKLLRITAAQHFKCGDSVAL